MRIGSPKEVMPGEARVAMTPESAAQLQKLGHECFIESGDMVLHVHDKVKWCETSDEVNWLGPDKDIADSISARLLHHQ